MQKLKSFLILLIFLPGFAEAAEISRTQLMMGDIPVTITVKTSPKKSATALAAMEDAYRIGRQLSDSVTEYNPASDTSRLNTSKAGNWIKVGDDLLNILEVAYAVSGLTDGAFDVTFASSNIKSSYRDVELDRKGKKARITRRGSKIGVSAIAKGYILDKMGETLKKQGFQNYAVNGGGDMKVGGSWKIPVRLPLKKEDEKGLSLAGDRSPSPLIVRGKNKGICTSGLYERGDHIMDPHTKKKIRPRHASVTVMANTATLADALATGFFVLGPEKTAVINKKLKSVRVFFLDETGRKMKALREGNASKHPRLR